MKRFLAAAFACATIGANAADPPFAIAVHGGAGHFTRAGTTPEKESACRAALVSSLEAGRKVLAEGGSSLDAVVAAIRVMEDSQLFNAGKGAVLTSESTSELDAAIMEGRERRAGAVAGITRAKNPVEAARAVMDRTRHVMLVGSGADRFAIDEGLAIVDPSYFRSEERLKQLQREKERERLRREQELPKPEAPKTSESFEEAQKFGTVGAVALDRSGNLAAATSTGGTTNKRSGRVGDSPIVGAGTWAENDSVAVSATGDGEMFIRSAAAHDIAALVKYKGFAPQKAADEVLAKVKAIDGSGGVIVMDRTGEPVFSFNTNGMYRGFAKGTARPETFLFR